LHLQLPAVEVFAVELRDRLVGLFRRRHLDETETTRATGVAVGHDRCGFDLPGRREHLTKPLGRCRERETADEQFLRHGTSPFATSTYCFHAVSSCAAGTRGGALESWPGETRVRWEGTASGDLNSTINYIKDKSYIDLKRDGLVLSARSVDSWARAHIRAPAPADARHGRRHEHAAAARVKGRHGLELDPHLPRVEGVARWAR